MRPPGAVHPVSPAALGALLVAGLIQVVTVNHWPGFASPNEWPRAYQALAVVSRGSLEVGEEVARHGASEDLAAGRGGLYPNKAPGLLPLLVPAALLARALSGGDHARELRLTLWLGRLLAASLPFLITVLLLDAATARSWPGGGRVAVVAYAFGSPALAASLLLFSHALSACLLLAGLLILHERGATASRAAAGGFLLGWAVVSEYSVAVAVAVIALAALPGLGFRRAMAAAAGGTVPMVALGVYNRVCFGSAFALSSGQEAHAAFAELASRGLFGVSWPTLSGASGLLLSPGRGALVWVPLLAATAWAAGSRDAPSPERARAAVAGLASIAMLVAMSGYPNWHGGWFAGPRYLLPVLPLALIAAAGGVERLLRGTGGRVALAVAGVWGAVMLWPLLASFPFPPADYPFPALTLAWPLLRAGVVAPSWMGAELSRFIIGAAFVAAAAALVAVATRRSRERFAAACVAMLLVALAFAWPRPDGWKARLELAVIADVYASGGRGGALETLRGRCATPDECAQVDAWIARRDGIRTP